MCSRFLYAALLIILLLQLSTSPASAMSGWTELPNAPVAELRHNDVFFVNPNLGWVVNSYGEIHRTTNGGESWELQLVEPVFRFRSVGFADTLKGWVGTLNAGSILFSTTDGGAIWTPVQNIPEPQPTGLCGICVVNDSVAYACGRYDGPARIIKTTDGGITWASSDVSTLASSLVDCYFLDESNGFVVGGIGPSFGTRKAVILATTNGGTTWEVRHTSNRFGEWCWKISFPTTSIGYVSIETSPAQTSYFLKTTDGGLTWEDLFFVANGYSEQGIGFVTNTLGWIGGHSGDPTYETNDGGISWHVAGFGAIINRFRFLSENLGYAVGNTVYKYSNDVAGITTEWPAPQPNLVLEQNHPNPFNRSTSIAYSLAHNSDVTMTIHNAQGRSILVLLKENQSAGHHEFRWDSHDRAGNPVPAGVYWYRLETDHDVQTKKILVVR
jgi:photosystem II stability/assembly factor-like uncharacterized protein